MKITAIDFETANGKPASVCAVGISVMEDGCVEEAYYSLIRPEDNVSQFSYFNIQVHGNRVILGTTGKISDFSRVCGY